MADNDEESDVEPTLYETCWRTFTSLSRAFLRKTPSEISFGKVTKANELLKTELEKAKLKLREQEDETENLYTALDDLEQYTRKNSLEIQGMPDQCYSTTEEVEIGECIKC